MPLKKQLPMAVFRETVGACRDGVRRSSSTTPLGCARPGAGSSRSRWRLGWLRQHGAGEGIEHWLAKLRPDNAASLRRLLRRYCLRSSSAKLKPGMHWGCLLATPPSPGVTAFVMAAIGR
jgi:hypothetical protein